MAASETAQEQARQRVEQSRQRRAGHAADSKAAGAIARMSRSMGEDAIGASLVDSLVKARKEGRDSEAPGVLVADAWSQAREQAQRERRSEARRARREREATGQAVADACEACRGIGLAADGEACEACRGSGRESQDARLARVLRHYRQGAWLTGEQVFAIEQAFAADGPVTKADHDPAGCAFPGCRKCAAIRQRTGEAHGALTREPRKAGQRRRAPGRQDHAPRERTTDQAPQGMPGKAGSVSLAGEAPLVRMLDATRAHYAAGGADAWRDSTGADALVGPQAAIVLATLATVTSAGRRGRLVAWEDASLALGLRASEAQAWRLATIGALIAACPGDYSQRSEATGETVATLRGACEAHHASEAHAAPVPRVASLRPASTGACPVATACATACATAQGASPGSAAWRSAARATAALVAHQAQPCACPASEAPALVHASQAPAPVAAPHSLRPLRLSPGGAGFPRGACEATLSAAHREAVACLFAMMAGAR